MPSETGAEIEPRIPMRRRLRRRRVALAVLIALAVAVASPPGRSRVKSVALALELFPSPIRPLRWFVPGPRRAEIPLGHATADLYRPRGFSTPPSIVLVHGAAPKGKDDPRIVNLARAVARTGRTVLVPQLALRDRRIDESDLELIRSAVAGLGGRIGVIAISYGGGLTLVALAEEPALQRRVAFVATIGTYFDLAHIIQGATTNRVPENGRLVRWEPAADARDVVAEQVAHLLGPGEGDSLRAAWARQDVRGLDGDARAAYEMLVNRDPARFVGLYAALPERLRRTAARLSPSTVVARLTVPVHTLHSLDDGASPASESRLMVGSLRERGAQATLIEVGILRHATPSRTPFTRAGEFIRVVRYIARLLRAQEGWPRI